MTRTLATTLLVLACVLPLSSSADTSTNGTFGFLTQTLPEGTTNAEYVIRFVTVNADGPVTFSVSELPTGLTLDPASGLLTGRPTETFNKTIDVTADDSVQTPVVLAVDLKINASGGGGNAGAEFGNASLLDATVGSVYAETLMVSNGTGPYIFGAKDLPPGIALDGTTGVLSGNPSEPGRYYVTLSANDAGENNNVATVLPLLVLPSGSTFQFTTQFLNNGEVGTPFCDTYLTAGGAGNVTFAASGLPPGISVDPATGIATGTPTTAGTFEVLLSANDGSDTILTNLVMVIAPSSSSNFYWDVFSLPAGLKDVPYDRQPPILVASVNGVNVSYAVSGLPPGLLYNTSTGELTGSPTEVGEFDVTFTATDAGTTEVLTLEMPFVVLPATGGDIGSVPVNFWVSKLKIKLGEDGSEAWGGALYFNADRRTGSAFDPALDDLTISLGSDSTEAEAGSLSGTSSSMAWKSEKGVLPARGFKLSLSKQTLAWATKSDSLQETLPGVHRAVLRVGDASYRMKLNIGEKGSFKGPFGFQRPSFVLTKGGLSAGAPGEDSAKLNLLLSDGAFFYEVGDELRVRILEGETVHLDRDFTALGSVKVGTDKSGALAFALKTLSDEQATDTVKKFSFSTKNGKMSLALAGLDLSGISDQEAHLSIEVTVGLRTYTTGVTFFGEQPGSYGTRMP